VPDRVFAAISGEHRAVARYVRRARAGALARSKAQLYTYTDAAAQTTAGLQKWVFDPTAGSWKLAYTLESGLNLGQPYTVKGYPTGVNPATGLPWSPATDGLRNITGRVNRDGTATIWAITSTVSGSGDQGAEPNKLVAITMGWGPARRAARHSGRFARRASARCSAACRSRPAATTVAERPSGCDANICSCRTRSRRLCTRTSTRSTRLSSNATILACAAVP
jgi:hypothetical protein